jgi:hypothetical protein
VRRLDDEPSILVCTLARGLAQVGGRRFDRGRVLREQAERLDVEGDPAGVRSAHVAAVCAAGSA